MTNSNNPNNMPSAHRSSKLLVEKIEKIQQQLELGSKFGKIDQQLRRMFTIQDKILEILNKKTDLPEE